MRLAVPLAAVLAAALACDAPKAPAPPAPPPPATSFTPRDLALATALDAKLAALTLVASDLEKLMRGGGARASRARRLLSRLRVARAEVERSAAAVSNPADGTLAVRVGALAGRYADALAAAVGGSAPVSAAHRGELQRAQGELAEAIDVYRRSRTGWRLELPPREGAERDFEDARRELERLEATLPPASPPAVSLAVRRAQATAGKLPSGLREPAARYASGQEKALAALRAGSKAADARNAAAAARAYHAAKVEALAALADYLAALASR
jgi:hypothetical protein